MPRKRSPRPTDRELAILNILWERGPSTVRAVWKELHRREPLGYTTALKMMQVMTAKGLLARDEQDRSHVYTARHAAGETQRHLVADLLDRAFGGSAAKLVVQALASRPASAAERAEIRRLLDGLEEDAR